MTTPARQLRILREIAEGSFGKVYLAEVPAPDGSTRQVAVKLLLAKWNDNDDVMRRTRDEARLLGRIRHDNIVKVEALTAIEGQLAILMEYLEGVDLRWMIKFLQEQRQIHPRKAAFEIGASVLSAMNAAYHSVPPDGSEPLRVIHRDIKPSNVFVTLDGVVKVLDYGTARATFSQREAVTQMNAFGSRGYMAPERLRGSPDSPAGDVFSLGITLWELLSLDKWGAVAIKRAQHDQQVIDAVESTLLQGDPAWAEAARGTLKRMLAWEPEQRPDVSRLVETMTMLASGAPDASLQDVTAAIVPEAVAALPVLDTGDPLVGRVIEPSDTVAPPVPPQVPPTLQRTVQPTHTVPDPTDILAGQTTATPRTEPPPRQAPEPPPVPVPPPPPMMAEVPPAAVPEPPAPMLAEPPPLPEPPALPPPIAPVPPSADPLDAPPLNAALLETGVPESPAEEPETDEAPPIQPPPAERQEQEASAALGSPEPEPDSESDSELHREPDAEPSTQPLTGQGSDTAAAPAPETPPETVAETPSEPPPVPEAREPDPDPFAPPVEPIPPVAVPFPQELPPEERMPETTPDAPTLAERPAPDLTLDPPRAASGAVPPPPPRPEGPRPSTPPAAAPTPPSPLRPTPPAAERPTPLNLSPAPPPPQPRPTPPPQPRPTPPPQPRPTPPPGAPLPRQPVPTPRPPAAGRQARSRAKTVLIPPREPVPRPDRSSSGRPPMVAPVEVVDSLAREAEGPDWVSVALLAAGAAVLLTTVIAVIAVVGVISSMSAPEDVPIVISSPLDRGKVMAPGTEAKQPRVPTELAYAGPAGARIQLEGPHGFRAEWTGAAPFDMGRLRVGTYSATVGLPGQSEQRLSFDVREGATECDLVLDIQANAWTGGCSP